MIAHSEFNRTTPDSEAGPVIFPAVITQIAAPDVEATSMWVCRVAHKSQRSASNLTLLIECPSAWSLEQLKEWTRCEYPSYISYSWLQIDIKMSVEAPADLLGEQIPF